MSPDQVAEILRALLREAMIVSAPILLAAALLSFVLSLFQTLTSLQEQSLTAVPRLFAVVVILAVGIHGFCIGSLPTPGCFMSILAATSTATERQRSWCRQARQTGIRWPRHSF